MGTLIRGQSGVYSTEAWVLLEELRDIRKKLQVADALYRRRATIFVQLRQLRVTQRDIADAAGTTPTLVRKVVSSMRENHNPVMLTSEEGS